MTDKLKQYFNGEMTAAEEVEFQRWLVSHSDDPAVVQAMSALFDGNGSEMDSKSVESSLDSLKDRLGLSGSHRFSSRSILITALAACICLAVALPLTFYAGRSTGRSDLSEAVEQAQEAASQAQNLRWAEVKVPNGRIDTLCLADGSTIFMNSGSRVTYPASFEGNNRTIFVDGEIYARIAKDPSRPFIVRSGDATVRVLGTTFNLKSYSDSDRIEASLIEGSVQLELNFNDASKQILMQPGNRVMFDRVSGNVEIQDFAARDFKSFKDGRALHFANLSMDDIAQELSRTFGVKIVVVDEHLARTKFFAYFTNSEDLDQILAAMNINGIMKIRKRDGVVYLSSNR